MAALSSREAPMLNPQVNLKVKPFLPIRRETLFLCNEYLFGNKMRDD
jgi:hypothetical protein